MERIQSSYSERNKRKIMNTFDYWIEYDDGRSLDLQCGNAAFVFGYSDQQILNTIKENNIYFIRNGAHETSAETETLINNLCNLSKLSGVSWAVSGSDGVESALEMNFSYWRILKENKQSVLSISPNYHGTTALCKSLRRKESTYVSRQLRDEDTLLEIENRLKHDPTIGCVIAESIPWIAGIRPYSTSFWYELRTICDFYEINLLIDDVAGSFGKLGHSFSHLKWNILPDITAVSKSLTGGYVPLSAALCNSKVLNVLEQDDWDHTHTWNPCALGVSVANTVVQKINHGILDIVPEIENKMQDMFEALNVDYSGQGLMWQINHPTPVQSAIYEGCGLTFNIYDENHLPMIVPLIADNIYFNELYQRLEAVVK